MAYQSVLVKDNAISNTAIYIGISSCLLGEAVRYDGGHKRDSYINGTLAQYFEFVPFCPEMAAGLGVPRPPIRLVRTDQGARALGIKDPELDPTDSLDQYAEQVASQIDHLSGYILKKGSPSCGMERVKLFDKNGVPSATGHGIYAAKLMALRPNLPVEEEGRLGDSVLRDNFIERVFVYHRWQSLLAEGFTSAKLVEFHARHKFLIQAHEEVGYRELGRLVADAGGRKENELIADYESLLMQTLKKRAGKGSHANVLYHLFGFLKEQLSADDKAEMVELIEQYRTGLVSLIVPITLLRHHFRQHPDPYIEQQWYLAPHPAELMLRNTV